MSEAVKSKIRSSKGDMVFTFFNTLLLVIITIITLYPLVFVLSASISDPNMVNSGRMLLYPMGFTLAGYNRVFANPGIWIGYRNTIFYTVFGTLLNLAVTMPCAYALAKKSLPGRKFFNFLFLFTMFFSGGLIPLYMLVKDLHLLDTIWAVLLPTAASIWNIIITRTFLETTIPDGLEEAAEIDGCSTFMKFFRIILPLSAPIIAVMALFYGVGHWNSYFNEMIFLSDRDKFPLQVFLRELIIITQIDTNSQTITAAEAQSFAEQQRLAGIIKYSIMVVSTLPIICVYPFLQRFFVKGVMVGSIKG